MSARAAFFLLAGLVAFPALANETIQVKTPVTTMSAEKVTNPAAGSVEATILTSLKMISAGDFDAWMKDYCAPELCPDDVAAREALKNYNLAATKKSAAGCWLDEGTSLVVTKRDGDAATATEVKYFIWCGETRMPAPASFKKNGDKWWVTSFSW